MLAHLKKEYGARSTIHGMQLTGDAQRHINANNTAFVWKRSLFAFFLAQFPVFDLFLHLVFGPVSSFSSVFGPVSFQSACLQLVGSLLSVLWFATFSRTSDRWTPCVASHCLRHNPQNSQHTKLKTHTHTKLKTEILKHILTKKSTHRVKNWLKSNTPS